MSSQVKALLPYLLSLLDEVNQANRERSACCDAGLNIHDFSHTEYYEKTWLKTEAKQLIVIAEPLVSNKGTRLKFKLCLYSSHH